MEPIGVGSTIWCYDENRRRYAAAPSGRIWGALIWREHWAPRKIVGETSRSWVLQGFPKTKVPKRGADPRLFAFSERELDERVWIHDNRSGIGFAVSQCYDYATMRKIAELLGYKAPSK